MRFLYDTDTAEDIVQDVFLELWSKQEQIKSDKNIKSHLFKSVYNRSINYLKSKSYKSQMMYFSLVLHQNRFRYNNW